MLLLRDLLLLVTLYIFFLQISAGYPVPATMHSATPSQKHAPTQSPAHIDEKREIRIAQIENRLAKKRLGQLKNEKNGYDVAVEEAANQGILVGHSHQQEWVKEHLKEVEAKKNVKLHKIASKVMQHRQTKSNEIVEILNARGKELKGIVQRHKEIKAAIRKGGGKFDYNTEETQHREDRKMSEETLKKKMICQELIDKNDAYLKRFEKSSNRCTIM